MREVELVAAEEGKGSGVGLDSWLWGETPPDVGGVLARGWNTWLRLTRDGEKWSSG